MGRSQLFCRTFSICVIAGSASCAAAPPTIARPRLVGGGATASLDGTGAELALGASSLHVALATIGRAPTLAAVDRAALRRAERGVDLERGSIVEWWRETPAGLEHGVTVAERPAGTGPLLLEIAFDGALHPSGEGASVTLLDDTGASVASYGGLVVLDAHGARAPATMRAEGDTVRIEVDDSRARYPLVVDPLVAVLEATLTSAAASDLGESVSAFTSLDTLGPVSVVSTTVLVGSPGSSTAHFFRRGSAATWAEVGSVSGAAGSDFGFSVVAMPRADLSCTGLVCREGPTYAVSAVGAPLDDTRGTNAGAVYVFGTSSSITAPVRTLLAPDGLAGDRFGFSVAADLGLDTLFVGAPYDDYAGRTDAGSVRVFSGATQVAVLTPPAAGAPQIGSVIATTGDGDRLIAGACSLDGAGGAFVFARTGSVWALETTLRASDASAGACFGSSVALSSDGSRALVGANQRSGRGGAYVFRRSGTVWTEEAFLPPPAGTTAGYGYAAALQADGAAAVLAAFGAPAVYTRTGTTWASLTTLARSGLAVTIAGASGTNVRIVVGEGSSFNRANVFRLGSADGDACTSIATCASNFCVDGNCCGTACGNGARDCQACSIAQGGLTDGACTALSGPIAPTVTCRAAAGGCDSAEVCVSGSMTCPFDRFLPATTTCRDSAGDCDVPETCSGTDPACPPDVLEPAGAPCRDRLGTCDEPDACDGTSPLCADVIAAAGAECRPSRGGCDPAESCDGSGILCPSDVLAPDGTECAPAAGDCDAPDLCTGTSADCMPLYLSGSVCRPSAGACDAVETCAGSSPSCPPDVVEAAGMVCRDSGASCDPVEACDGTAAECPADVSACGDAGGVSDAGGGSDAATADASGATPRATAGCACRSTRRGQPNLGALLLAATLLCVRARRPR